MKLAVLTGGKGTRLGLTDRPKPMVPLGGVPLLDRIVTSAVAHGFADIVLLNGHMAEAVEEYFGDGARFGARIAHVRELAPLGTAGAVRAAAPLLDAPFLLAYGDTLMDVDLAHLAAAHRGGGGLATLFVHPNDHPYDSDLVEADDDRRITRFFAKPHPPGGFLPNLAYAALCALDPAILAAVPADRPSDWGRDIFPQVVGEHPGALRAYRSVEYIKDMGTPDRLAAGEADLASGRLARMSRRTPKPALFLDRDGVINVEIDGVHRAEDLVLLPGAAAAIRRANRAGVPVICVTNQPALAKGFMDAAALRQVHAALDTLLGRDHAYLDDLYFCPHHPEPGWPGEVSALKVACACRKPKPGLLLAAAADHCLDLSRSWLVGDRATDIMAAHAAGARGILLHEVEGVPPAGIAADATMRTLEDAVTYVLTALR